MPTQSGSIDLNSYKMVNDNASKTATNYIQADSTGIKIANANPATATTYQHQTATNTEFIVDGVSQAEISGTGARFGATNGTRLLLDNTGITLKSSNNNSYAYIYDTKENSNSLYYQVVYCKKFYKGSVSNYSYTVPFSDYIEEIVNIEITNDPGSSMQPEAVISSNHRSITVSHITAFKADRLLTITLKMQYDNDRPYGAITLGNRNDTYPSGPNSLSVGQYIAVSGSNSGAIGKELIVTGSEQFVCGIFNENDPSKQFIVGIGKNEFETINGFSVSRDGTAETYHDLNVGHDLNVVHDLTVGGYVRSEHSYSESYSVRTRNSSNNSTPYSVDNCTYYKSGSAIQLCFTMYRRTSLTIPATGIINEEVGFINESYSSIFPSYNVTCVATTSTCPLFIKIQSNGLIIVNYAPVNQATAFPDSEYIQVSATYLVA